MKTSLSAYDWDWPLAGLMVVLVYTSAGRLSITDWTPHLWATESLAVLGTILGLLLGVSKFRLRAASWLLAGYSWVILPWLLTELISGEKTALGRLASLGGRLGTAAELVFQRKAVDEPLFFVALMCLLFWLVGSYSGYQAMRGSGISKVVLPSVIPLLVAQYYDGIHFQRIWMVGFYFFIAILVIGRLNILANRERWKAQHMFIGNDLEFDLSRGLAIAAAVIIFSAWALPAPAAAIPAIARVWQEANKPFENTRKRLDDILAAVSGGRSAAVGELYGKTMGLGQSAGQGEAEIFTARPLEFMPIKYYWRVRIYDNYEKGRWSTYTNRSSSFNPDTTEPVDWQLNGGQVQQFIFNWKTARTTLLVTPTYPLWASRNGNLQLNPLAQETPDLLSWGVQPPVERGDQYQVDALVVSPTIKDLRAAGEVYPEWVKAHYLTLPAELSDDIPRLAKRLTEGQETPYDKTVAITNYLRNNMEYSLTIPAPPPGVDPVNWFLFTWKSGFCNYYASAEVLLLRSVGIPARLVVGYAPGEYQPNGTYKISAKDAHAWPEVYFPGHGWIEFEPTASLDPIFRPSGENRARELDDAIPSLDERLARTLGGEPDFPNPNELGGNGENATASTNSLLFSKQSAGLWVIIFMVVILGSAGLIWRAKRQPVSTQSLPQIIKKLYLRYNFGVPVWLERWVRWSEVTPVERAFHAVNQSLGWLGKAQAKNITAFERAELLKQLVPSAATEIDLLAAAHEQTLYTPEPANQTAAARAAWLIRFQTLRALFRHWLYGEREDE